MKSVSILAANGTNVGLGHLRRCVSLATALRDIGIQSVFERVGDPFARELLARHGFAFNDGSGDVIVADSYDLDDDQLRSMQQQRPVVVLDDLAERSLDVAVVVNGAAGAERLPYVRGPHTTYLLGPQYALLRREFAQPPRRSQRPRVERLLLTTGGGDARQLTERLLAAMRSRFSGIAFDVVLGPYAQRSAAVDALASGTDRVTIHQDPSDMFQLMMSADIGVSGGGQTTYEFAAVGTPAVAICLVPNQEWTLTNLAASGAVVDATARGGSDEVASVVQAVETLVSDYELRTRIGNRGQHLVDGLGCMRVAKTIAGLVGDRR